MRVLLIQSLNGSNEPLIFPLGLCYLAAHLPNDIKIFDMNTAKEPYKDLVNELKRIKPDVVGISLRNIKVAAPGTHYSCFAPHQETIKIIKKCSPGAVLIAGGPAFSLYGEIIMRQLPEIDLGVFGEGEESFREILENLDHPEKVRGIYYRRNGEIYFTGYQDWLPFEKLRWPRRNLLDINGYFKNPFGIGVQTKRGCILKCIHCSDRYLVGSKIRLRSPQDVVDELEVLVKANGVKSISFVDQIFNIPLTHAQEICQEIIKRRLSFRWVAWFNAKYITEEFIRLVKESGCAQLSFSPDSASNKVLRKLKKGFDERDLLRTYKIAKKVGIPVEYHFMINCPGENLKSLFKTLSFILKAKLNLKEKLIMYPFLMITPMRIYPHTELMQLAIKDGIINDKTDLMEPIFYNPPPLKYMVEDIRWIFRFIWWTSRKFKKT